MSDRLPLVSCLLPTRDRPEFLRQALRCFARQTYPNRELLVLDGGETRVEELCAGINGVRYIDVSPERTYGASMNVGAGEARGTILQKLDDDDYYAPTFVERSVAALVEHGPDEVVVGWDCFHVFVRGDHELRFSGHGWAADGTLALPRSLWERVRFRESPGEFESVLKDHCGAKLVQVCAPELYILIRHGGNNWQSLRGIAVDDYFLSLPRSGLTIDDLMGPEEAAFYDGWPGMRAPAEVSLRTGLSDDAGYLRSCREASVDDRRFGEFRRDPEYTRVLEHVSKEQGAAYLEVIRNDAELLAMMPELCRNDRVGNPRTSLYEGVGEVSPTTLRYVKVLADLKRHFGTLDGLSICEIGPGYGGQCRLICACFAPAHYQLVDLEAPLGLARRYLSSFELTTEVTFRTMAELEPRRFDLVISNYAFSELRRPVQEVYLDKVVLGAERGYITCNQITPPEFESYRPADLAALLPTARLVAEEPLTYPGNCILVWGSFAP